VSSWIKPGAKMEELVVTLEKDLGISDVIISNVGANNVNSENSNV
jgi:hypothetical protein